jgi:hypothetical protein
MGDVLSKSLTWALKSLVTAVRRAVAGTASVAKRDEAMMNLTMLAIFDHKKSMFDDYFG